MARQIKVASSEAAKEIAAIMAAGCTYVSNYKHYDLDVTIHVNENGSRSYTEVYEGGEFSYISISGAASEPEAIIEIGNVEKSAATMAIDLRGYAAALIELDELRTEIYRAKKKIGRSRNEKAIAQAEEEYAALVKQEHEKDAAFWKNYGELNEQVQSDAALMAEYEKVCDELQAEQARQQAEETSKAVAAALEAEKNGYVAKISTSTGDKGIWRSSKKIFKSAVAAFKFLDKKEFAPLTYWSVEIEHNGETIYWNGGNGGIDGEGTTDAEIQALIDASKLEKAIPTVRLNVRELKAARALMKEFLAERYQRLRTRDAEVAAVAIAMIDRLEEMDAWNCGLPGSNKDCTQMRWGILHNYCADKYISESELKQDHKKWIRKITYRGDYELDPYGLAVGLEYFNWQDYIGDSNYRTSFNVSDTHGLDRFSFNRLEAEALSVYVLEQVFSTYSINGVPSCYDLSGSKYRPTNRRLAFKIVDLINAKRDYAAAKEAATKKEEPEVKKINPVAEKCVEVEALVTGVTVSFIENEKAMAAPVANPQPPLNVKLTAYAPTRFQLSRLRTLLIHLDAASIDINNEGWFDSEISGDVAPLTFTAEIPSSTYDIIADAAGETENPIIGTDADIAKARAPPYDERTNASPTAFATKPVSTSIPLRKPSHCTLAPAELPSRRGAFLF